MNNCAMIRGYGKVIIVDNITDIPNKAYYDGDDKDTDGIIYRVYCLENKSEGTEVFYGFKR